MHRKEILIALALILGLVLFNAFPAQAKEPLKLKFGHHVVATHPIHRTVANFAAKVGKYSKGDIAITVYPGGQLGGERDLLEGLRLGTVHFYWGSTAVASQFVPEFLLFHLPYLVRDFRHGQRIWSQFLEQRITPKAEKAGFKVLGIYDGGERGLATRKPVMKLEDLKGMRVRTMEAKISIESYKALGTIATPIPFPDLISALSQGVVDGADYSLQTFFQGKVYQVTPYFVHTGMTRAPGILAVAQDLWRKLPKEQKDVIQKSASEAIEEDYQYLEEFTRQSEREARESNFPFGHTYPEIKGFREIAKSVYPKFEKELGREMIDRMLAIK